MTDPDELRRLAAAATRARTSGRTIHDVQHVAAFQDACITAIPELLDALEAARKDAAELRADTKTAVAEMWRMVHENADLRRQLAGLGIPTEREVTT